MNKIKASAPGKVILAGEHFVVENQPAIASAINLRTSVYISTRIKKGIEIYSKNYDLHRLYKIENGSFHDKLIEDKLYPIYFLVKYLLNTYNIEVRGGLIITIDSDIPPGSGLGSSAAVSVATVAALSKFFNLNLSLEDISKIAYKAEEIIHGKPSGIDNTISTFGGVILYKKTEGFIRINSKLSDMALILADSGIPRFTKDMVLKVQKLRKKYPEIFDPIYYAAGKLVRNMVDAIKSEDLIRLGELMNINHGLLSTIGVSNMFLEKIVYTSRKLGALGAKITGAGGGGLVLAISRKERAIHIYNGLKEICKKVILTEVSEKGVL